MNNLDFNFFCTSCAKSKEYRAANCFTNYTIREYKTGDYIAYRGETAKQLSILVKGSTDTRIVLDSGVSFTSTIHKAPYVLGALALFSTDRCYRADFIALEDCVTISVGVDDIEDQMFKCRKFFRSFMAYNISKFDVITRHLSVLSYKSLKARLSFYILSIATEGNFRFDRKLDDLAIYFSAERPSLSRVIAQFVEQGLIEYHRGEGRIINHAALKNMLE